MFKIAHIAIVVKDIEVSKKFYSSILNAKYLGENMTERLNFAYLDIGGQTIELLKYNETENVKRKKGVIDHIAFYVEDIEKEVERLRKLGIGLLFDNVREVNDMKIMFFEGPDGERIEIMEKL